ncbi:MAG TPA: hypothetical protein VNO31_45045 [Umezawaea sp.]|nr:hypothetical protein [Umezawaea sp.]
MLPDAPHIHGVILTNGTPLTSGPVEDNREVQGRGGRPGRIWQQQIAAGVV